MKGPWWIALILLSWTAPALLSQAAPDGTPERALQDMALATKPEEIEKHLPVATLDDAKTLDPEDLWAFESSLLWRQANTEDQSEVAIPEDGRAFLVVINNHTESEIQLTDTVNAGSDAVLRFAIRGPAPVPMEVMAWMRYEDGVWRLRELDTGLRSRIRFDDPDFVERFRNREQKSNESSAMSTLSTLRWAVQSFADAFPEIGIPEDLSALGEAISSGDDAASGSRAFLNPEMAHSDYESGGYRFHYQALRSGPEGKYVITARPLQVGKSGRFSYLLDESGQIHETEEDREATTDDPGPGGYRLELAVE